MPPVDSKLSLSTDDINRIGNWIEQNAPWSRHWSFVAPQKAALPQNERGEWHRNEIDHFVLARIEQAGLEPTATATREQLVRRLSFDLTGLPPTLQQIDGFLSDKSDKAYERLVDRLLASQAYGEHMTSTWLDVARYSDTYGFQVDRDRHVWPWRDWVIGAFNANLSYDKFIAQQVAGDLLPDATDDTLLATTFNRLHPQKVEGGSVPEEFRVEYVADRAQTFATAFLGLTMECCRCHDHKYDPITQKEYYELFAFFDKIDESGLYSYFTNSVPTPTMFLMSEDDKEKVAELQATVAAGEQKLTDLLNSRRDEFQDWLSRNHPAPAENADQQEKGDKAAPDIETDLNTTPGRVEYQYDFPGQVAYLSFDDGKEIGNNKSVDGKLAKAVLLTGDDALGTKVGNFSRDTPFSFSLWMKTPTVFERAVVLHRSRAWTDSASRGYQLLIEDGHLSAALIHFWPGNALCVRTAKPIPVDQWIHVTVTYDGSSKASGLTLYVDGSAAGNQIIRDNLYKNITGSGGDNITLGERFRDIGFKNGLVDELRVFQRELTDIEARHLADGESLDRLLDRPAKDLSADEADSLYEFYLSDFDQVVRDQRAAVREARKARDAFLNGRTEIMVMREMELQRRQTYTLKRGAYDAPDQAVDPGTPQALNTFSEDYPRNRWGLSQWLTSPDNPLTARVAVNRFWQMCFGEGLVRTPEDFGSQGQPPTHPELLDWLAVDFVEHGWDIKRLLKQIVMSATYRQAVVSTPEKRNRDPENRLLARAPRYRLSAEMLRDNALATSGLLVAKIGGQPARPYEVGVSFKPVTPDKGAGLYRRSLYTYWKRTGPAPVMMTLDASKRDVCRVKRERTTSPLQAFVLLNDPQFVEAARALAVRQLTEHKDDAAAAMNDVFRLLTSRQASEKERDVLQRLFEKQIAYFQEQPERAIEYLKTGQAPLESELAAERIAALAVVASTLMNYDGAVMRP